MRLALLLSLGLTCVALADETWSGLADVRFKGYSTLHNFEGTVSDVPLKVSVSGGKGNRVVDATSGVPVKDMSTANKDRDRGMRTMFHDAQYKLIKVEVAGAKEQELKPRGATAGTMPVMLTIAGTRGTVNGAVTNVSETPSNVSFDLAFPVSLKAFKLEPPKSLGGLVSVKDTVDVTARVTLKKSKAE